MWNQFHVKFHEVDFTKKLSNKKLRENIPPGPQPYCSQSRHWQRAAAPIQSLTLLSFDSQIKLQLILHLLLLKGPLMSRRMMMTGREFLLLTLCALYMSGTTGYLKNLYFVFTFRQLFVCLLTYVTRYTMQKINHLDVDLRINLVLLLNRIIRRFFFSK